MSSENPADTEHPSFPRAYRIAPFWLAVCLASGFVFVAMGLFSGWAFSDDSSVFSRKSLVGYGLALFFVSTGVYAIAGTLRFKITLYANAIECRNLLSTVRLDYDEIAGIQRERSNVVVVVVVPVTAGRKKIKYADFLKTDAAFQDWLTSLPDLDERDQQQAEADTRQSESRLAEDARFGATPQARLARLARARTVVRWLNIAAFLTIFWAFFPQPYQLAILSIAILPWIGVALAATSRGLYRVTDDPVYAAHPTVGFLFFLPGLALCARAFLDIHVVDWKLPVAAAFASGLSLAFIFSLLDPRPRLAPWKVAMVFGLIMTAYAYGGLVLANTLLDTSKPQMFRTIIVDKHITSGKTTTYELRLEAWGPVPPGTVSVSRELYESVIPGRIACPLLSRGALGIPWYVVVRCY